MHFRNLQRKVNDSILTLACGACTVLFLAPGQAEALVEFRGGYTQSSLLPEEINAASPSHPKLENLYGLTADLILSLKIMPVDFGARFEVFSEKEKSGYNEIEAAWNRVSLLIGRRIRYGSFYFGPLSSIGVSNDFKYSIITASTRENYRSTDNVSASIALESGFQFSYFTFGGELGYTFAPLGELRTPSGDLLRLPDTTPVKVDLSGSYLRATIGFAY